jgi:lipid-binding SYLF domain-containing protein
MWTRSWANVCAGLIVASGVVGVGASITGCSTAPRSEAERSDIRADADQALILAKRNDPTLSDFLARSAGYAVFPTVSKGGFVVGGAYGRGVLYERGVPVGFCDLSQGSVGAQVGGQAYTQIIAFETTDAVQRFKSGNFALAAQATAVALRSGAGANARYENNVAVFTMDEAGLMAEAAIGGQKFSFQPF